MIKAAQKVGKWTNKNFSAGGKEVLIKSVIQAIPTYTMSCFRVPVTVCNNVEKVCARFWWGDKEKEKHMHWMTWKEMCKPKSHGGMGFRSLVEFNQALLAKQIWRLIKFPDSLVSQCLKARYFPSSDVMQAKIPSNCSFVWRSLMWGSELLKKGLRWKVGNGLTVRVYEDAWLPNLYEGMTIRNVRGCEELRVADLMDDMGVWNKEALSENLLPVEVEEALHLDKSDIHARDERYWSFDQRGVFNVKSGYLVATKYFESPGCSSVDENRQWWKMLWSFDMPPRVRIFVWRCVRNVIPTTLNLSRHHVPVFGRCGWCRRDWGSTSHVLIYCEKVRNWWMTLDCWSVLKKWEGFSMWEIAGAMFSSQSRHVIEIWLMGLWLVWKKLCAEKFEGKSCPDSDFRWECESYLESYAAAAKNAALATKVLPTVGGSSWKRPKRGRLRLDVDYAVEEERNVGGVGAIVRDCKGNVLAAMAKPVAKAMTILHGELTALVLGIRLCIEQSLSPLEVYSDSMLAIIAVAEDVAEESILPDEYFKFFSMAKSLNVLSINHVGREANKAAHELARFARSIDSTLTWHDNWPSWLSNIVIEDDG